MTPQKLTDKRRLANVLRAQLPFHLQLPDVTPERVVPRMITPEKISPARISPETTPETTPEATPGKLPPAVAKPKSTATPAAVAIQPDDPVARARARISKKRFEDGHQNVTHLLDRMRDRRRKLFGKLWVASIVLTALSIVALAVQLLQGLSFSTATAESIPASAESEAPRATARKTPARPQGQIVQAEAQASWSDSPDAAARENRIKSALYTTTTSGKPKGVWLDGNISSSEDDSDEQAR